MKTGENDSSVFFLCRGNQMTIDQKQQIIERRRGGQSYVDIATALLISENTIKSFCRRNNIVTNKIAAKQITKRHPDLCRHCGKSLKQGTKGHPKKFCSEECRRQWWKDNDALYARKAFYTLACKECGTAFESYGNQARKFCGHACYIKNRFGRIGDACDRSAI